MEALALVVWVLKTNTRCAPLASPSVHLHIQRYFLLAYLSPLTLPLAISSSVLSDCTSSGVGENTSPGLRRLSPSLSSSLPSLFLPSLSPPPSLPLLPQSSCTAPMSWSTGCPFRRTVTGVFCDAFFEQGTGLSGGRRDVLCRSCDPLCWSCDPSGWSCDSSDWCSSSSNVRLRERRVVMGVPYITQ